MTGRGLRGRERARLVLGAVLALDVLLAILFLTMPNTMRPMFEAPPSLFGLPLGWPIVAIGIALHLVGLVWMIRILRADPEGHRPSSRSVRSR